MAATIRVRSRAGMPFLPPQRVGKGAAGVRGEVGAAGVTSLQVRHRFPSIREGGLLRAAGDGERWAALVTFPHREKRAARLCTYLGLRHYLPLRRRAPACPDGPPLTEPLFAGYLFAVVDGEANRELLGTGTVAKVIPVPSERVFLAELRQVRSALEAVPDLNVVPALRRGEWVRVVHGRLSGVENLAVDLRRRRHRRQQLVLNVTLLGRGAALEVDLDDVRRIAPGPEFARGEDSPAATIPA